MAYTSAQVTVLEAALASGALSVRYGAGADSRTVTYRSQAEMRRQLAIMKAELGSSSNVKSHRASFKRSTS